MTVTSAPPTRRCVPLVLAVAYVFVWIVGLVIGAPEIVPGDSGATVAAAYAGAPLALLQAVLVHGVAGVLVAALGVAHARGPRLAGWRSRAVVIAGLAAMLLSFVQLAAEIPLALGAGPTESARTLWTVAALADGVKMLMLAALVVACAVVLRSAVFRILSLLTAASLVLSGVGYLALHAGLMGAAYASLPLLLVWALVSGLPARSR